MDEGEALGEALPDHVSSTTFLSGPSFAKDIAAGRPADVSLAAPEIEVARHAQDLLHSPRLRVYASDDIVGVQLDGALKNLEVAVRNSGAEIIRGPLPTITGDASQLLRVFQNLIGNALKFRGEDPPRIEVSAERQDAEWVISVRDNGIGIEEKGSDRIFLLFQKLHSKMEYEGTGLGLAIATRIVTRHGGRIWVDSEPDRGSIFSFTLPYREDLNSEQREPA